MSVCGISTHVLRKMFRKLASQVKTGQEEALGLPGIEEVRFNFQVNILLREPES